MTEQSIFTEIRSLENTAMTMTRKSPEMVARHRDLMSELSMRANNRAVIDQFLATHQIEWQQRLAVLRRMASQ